MKDLGFFNFIFRLQLCLNMKTYFLTALDTVVDGNIYIIQGLCGSE